jgi:hypothetical protein
MSTDEFSICLSPVDQVVQVVKVEFALSRFSCVPFAAGKEAVSRVEWQRRRSNTYEFSGVSCPKSALRISAF